MKLTQNKISASDNQAQSINKSSQVLNIDEKKENTTTDPNTFSPKKYLKTQKKMKKIISN